MLRDLWPGAGWGLIDSEGRPKQALRALKPVLSAATAFLTDEGLNGLWVHVVNDGSASVSETDAIVIDRPTSSSFVLELKRPGSWSVDNLAGRFSDSSFAYRFGPQRSRPTLSIDGHLVTIETEPRP